MYKTTMALMLNDFKRLKEDLRKTIRYILTREL